MVSLSDPPGEKGVRDPGERLAGGAEPESKHTLVDSRVVIKQQK